MKALTYVQFEDEERDELVRALAGHDNALEDPPRRRHEENYRPVRAHLGRLREHNAPYDEASLRELDETLRRLIILWMPETTVERWRALGATGSDDAAEGLAQERRNAIERAELARDWVRDGLRLVTGEAAYV